VEQVVRQQLLLLSVAQEALVAQLQCQQLLAQ
jgi:hypothetical protein